MTAEGTENYGLRPHTIGALVLAVTLASVGYVLLKVQAYPWMATVGLMALGFSVVAVVDAFLTQLINDD
jgi:hypothetical protein